MLGDEQQALETMQDVFLQILRRKDSLDDHAVAGLLTTTATRLSLNRIRSRHRRPAQPDTEHVERIAAATRSVDQAEARSLLGRALGREPNTAVVAVLHFHDGLTLEQTAKATGLSVSGVRFRLRKLKSVLTELRADG